MAKVFKIVCGKVFGKESEKSGSVCCLCFNPVDEDAISVNDRVTLEFDPTSENLTEEILARILVSVIGRSVTENMSVFQLVCKKCSLEAITSYKFIQNCRKNTKILIEAIQDLTNSLEIVSDNTDYETLFVSVDPKSKSIQQIYDLEKQSNPKKTLARFKFIVNGASNRVVTTDTDSWKRDTSTIFIKTHELLADPSKPKEYKCKFCLKVFVSSGNLRQHFFSRHMKRKYQCTECSRSFSTVGRLQTHIQLGHKFVECSECGKKLQNRKNTIKKHLEIHNRAEKICHKCGRKYKKIKDYEKHIAQDDCKKLPHRIPSNYICDYCNLRCSYKYNLAQHIRFEHLGQQCWVCQWCSKKCYTAHSFKRHIVIHTKERNFSCTQCGGKFVTQQSLTNHIRLHTGERPYKCELCGEAFLSATRRQNHVEKYHSSLLFQCRLCPAKYTLRSSRNSHMRKKHSDAVKKFK